MVDVARYRSVLEARKAELEERLEEIEQQLEKPLPKDWEDAATELEAEEVLEREAILARDELVRINAALKRMEEGEYGYCVECGDEIAPERLDLVPWTPFCARCAASHDHARA